LRVPAEASRGGTGVSPALALGAAIEVHHQDRQRLSRRVELVGIGEADLAITTPSHRDVRWAFEGRHFYGGRAFPHLRTLGCLPQDVRTG